MVGCSGAPQLNDDELGRAAEADRHEGASDAGGGISLHGFIAPVALGILARAIGELHQGADAGKADLAGVGVTAQIEIDAGGGGFAEHLGGMGEKQFEALFRHILRGLLEVVAAEEMRVVDSNHPERVTG